MSLFIDRTETATTITYIYKSQPMFYILFLVSFGLLWVENMNPMLVILSNIMAPIFFVYAIGFLFAKRESSRAIRAAMKTGKVKISGSKFSFRNPVKFEIEK